MDVDILLVGGGPASAALATAMAPLCRVAMLECRTEEMGHRMSESLLSAARHVLSDLGVLESFLAEQYPHWHRSVSVWGVPNPAQTDFVTDPNGSGWHVDRLRFDSWLRGICVERGTLLFHPAKLIDIKRRDRWHVTARTPTTTIEITARVVVDGTGRRRVVARRLRAHRHSRDKLLARFVHGVDRNNRARGLTFVEAEEDGWWYTAPSSSNKRVLVFHTDADLPAARSSGGAASFVRAAFQTPQLARLLSYTGFEPEREVRVISAQTSVLGSPIGDGWLAVGDAALACDPVASQGLFNALFTGLAAARALRDHFAGDGQALDVYRSLVNGITSAYTENHARCYGAEKRWPDSPFWIRRHRAIEAFSG